MIKLSETDRLEKSPYFCRMREAVETQAIKKIWSESEYGELDWGEIGASFLAYRRFALPLQALEGTETDCFMLLTGLDGHFEKLMAYYI